MSDRSPEEQRILEDMVDRQGEKFVEENADLILAQAKIIGEHVEIR